jgi:hypothetical protein
MLDGRHCKASQLIVNRTKDPGASPIILALEALRCFLWIASLGGSSVHSAPLSPFKIESDINGILPAGRKHCIPKRSQSKSDLRSVERFSISLSLSPRWRRVFARPARILGSPKAWQSCTAGSAIQGLLVLNSRGLEARKDPRVQTAATPPDDRPVRLADH